jgi:hypothetical protein
MVAFERYMTFRKSGGNHCHLNVLPLPAGAAAGARAAFEAAAERHGFALQPLEGPSKVCRALPRQCRFPFVSITLRSAGSRMSD